MNRIICFISVLFSIILYWLTPIAYDHIFCIRCFIVFLIIASVILYDDIKRIGFINYNILFFFSFFSCTYVYPVFLVNQDSIIGDYVTSIISSTDTINRATSLSTLAISIYSWVYCLKRAPFSVDIKTNEKHKAIGVSIYSKKLFYVLGLITLVILFNFMNSPQEVDIEVNESPLIMQLFDAVLPIYLVSSAISMRNASEPLTVMGYVKRNAKEIVLLVVLIVLYLFIGDRLPIITIITLFLSTVYLFIKRLRPITLIGIGLFGIVLMFAIRETRQGSSSLRAGGGSMFVQSAQSSISDNSSMWDVLSDLVGQGKELNEGVYYVEHKGHVHPLANALLLSVAPVPLLPSYLVKLFFGLEPSDIKSGPVLGSYNEVGGNHCVVDIYMPFGVLGVVFFFSIFGLMIAIIENGLKDNLFCKIFYVYLISTAIFVARNSITGYYRALVFSYVIYFILLYINRSQQKKIVS